MERVHHGLDALADLAALDDQSIQLLLRELQHLLGGEQLLLQALVLAAKGLERGDVVLAVNNVKVRTLDDISRAVENAYSRSSLVLSVLREPYVYNLTFGME